MTSELKPCASDEVKITKYDRPITMTDIEEYDGGCMHSRATRSENMGSGGSCETTELLNDLRFRLENMPPDSATDEALINRIIKHVAQLSATPSTDTLAGLQRYRLHWHDFDTADMETDSEGEYVLYSEAAKIIAELDNRACIAEYRFENAINFVQPLLMRRAEAAEAELAQIKAQGGGE